MTTFGWIVVGILGAFVVSAKYADSGDKKEGPRGPEGPQGPRGPEGPSGSPSDYSGIIEAINQVNTSIEKNRNRNYRNEQALHRYIRRLIDLKKELNDTYGVQEDVKKEDFLKKLLNLIRSTRSINYYYYGTPMYGVINSLNDNNLNVYSANEINRLIDDLIYYSL
ncbi:collagen-like triple helix repeat-containing protein [Leuconostoc mesenteroides]|uniref:collagen-like triple helix repeat-containing protein n=1 Tax=Leuconostoc mesenteroides TaxID=1245 RepID=UPI00123A43DF|nr:collagen-like protein [Leuconostoc mesenteroides]KAA8347278.1 collagen-like protein [Leuconostoc mesenteroides]